MTSDQWTVLDLFSAAAGGWSLGMHRAGFQTVAACEWIDWRRALYAENNPGVLLYEDVRDVTADRIRADLGAFPDIVVGSPPCQDISSANTKGKGVEGERSGLYFEAVRIIGEGRPRWFALENSANLRTRGADAVLGALEGHGYACWAAVVGGNDIGANHERKRAWIIGCDLEQLADAPEVGRLARAGNHQSHDTRVDWRLAGHDADDGDASDSYRQFPDGRTEQPGLEGQGRGLSGARAAAGDFGGTDGAGTFPGRHGGLGVHGAAALDAASLGHEGGRAWRHGPHGDGEASAPGGAGNAPHADQAGQADGSLVARLRQAEIADDGCGSGRGADRQGDGQMGLRPSDRRAAFQHRADWSLDDLARHIRLDDGLPAWLAEQRIAVGGPRGTSAASLVVEAFGDAVLPQIPEAIGRAILRVEAAYAAIAPPIEGSMKPPRTAGMTEEHKPVRVQLSRAKGWRMPANTVKVTRGPGMKYGNPFVVGSRNIPDAAEAVRLFRCKVVGFMSNGSFCRPVAHPDSYIGRIIANAKADLRGKNLACWCPLDGPCHADVLLEVANYQTATGEQS